MTLWEDLGIAEVVLGDVVAFAGGQPATVTRAVSGYSITDSIVHLPSGPAQTGYQVFSGSVWQILGLLLADAGAAQAGAPVQIAEKVGNSWYGHTLTITKT